MSVTVGLHVSDSEKLEVSSTVHNEGKAAPFVVTRMSVGSDTVSVFVSDVADIDRLAFEFETLARELRESYGWTPKH